VAKARFDTVFSLQITAETATVEPEAPTYPSPACGGGIGGGDRSVDQPVEFGGVLAGDFVHDFGGEAGELLLDVF